MPSSNPFAGVPHAVMHAFISLRCWPAGVAPQRQLGAIVDYSQHSMRPCDVLHTHDISAVGIAAGFTGDWLAWDEDTYLELHDLAWERYERLYERDRDGVPTNLPDISF